MCGFAAPNHTASTPHSIDIRIRIRAPQGYTKYIHFGAYMPCTTPIAHNKTAALARVLDSIPKGYTRWTAGAVKPDKAVPLANKFHQLYAIGATPAQRITRKAKGFANAILVLYWPEVAEQVEWLMLVTAGTGFESEKLVDIDEKPRLRWLGYELIRHAQRGKTSWTWRRPKSEMAELFALHDNYANRYQPQQVADLLARAAHQPGFHGVREQTRSLIEHALRRGFQGEVPHLFFVQKLSHGTRLTLA